MHRGDDGCCGVSACMAGDRFPPLGYSSCHWTARRSLLRIRVCQVISGPELPPASGWMCKLWAALLWLPRFEAMTCTGGQPTHAAVLRASFVLWIVDGL